MKLYILSHLGLGDNITMLGMIHYMKQYYDVYFICKDTYTTNVELLIGDPSVHLVPVDSKREMEECHRIISNVSSDDDVAVCGFAHSFLHGYNRIRNVDYVQDKSVKTDFYFINDFYWNVGLDLRIYYSMFDIKSTEKSIQVYETIKHFKIHFLHTKGSSREVDFKVDLDKTDVLYVNANRNVYPATHDKYTLADTLVNIPVGHYVDIIKNAYKIQVINSCFSCIVYPLVMTGKIDREKVEIVDQNFNSYPTTDIFSETARFRQEGV